MNEFKVTLSKGGRHIVITVMAESTHRAYKQAEHLYPGCRALNAKMMSNHNRRHHVQRLGEL